MTPDKSYINEFVKNQKIFLATEKRDILRQQKIGAYPQKFSMPVGIQFELTSKCNFSCKHCYNRSSADSSDSMTVHDWKRVVGDVVAHGGIFQCIISGGEPLLLGDSVYEIMHPLCTDGTAFVLITNGYLVTETIVSAMKAFEYYWVQVSIDHLYEDKHDDFRGKQGSWKRAVQAAELFSSAGFPLRIAHSVSPANLQYLEEFIDFSYMLGASSVVCGDIMLSGRTAMNKDLLMDDGDLNTLYMLIDRCKVKYAGKMNILASLPEYLSMKSRSAVPNSSVIIRPNGDVRLDCTMPFVIGNVLQRPFSEIWRAHGNTCWQDPAVKDYIYKHQSRVLDGHINHWTPDIRLY